MNWEELSTSGSLILLMVVFIVFKILRVKQKNKKLAFLESSTTPSIEFEIPKAINPTIEKSQSK